MQRSDLKDAAESCELLFDLTQCKGDVVRIYSIHDAPPKFKSMINWNGKTFYANSLVECLRAAKADEPAAPQE